MVDEFQKAQGFRAPLGMLVACQADLIAVLWAMGQPLPKFLRDKLDNKVAQAE